MWRWVIKEEMWWSLFKWQKISPIDKSLTRVEPSRSIKKRTEYVFQIKTSEISRVLEKSVFEISRVEFTTF